jgi:hypothetical protein
MKSVILQSLFAVLLLPQLLWEPRLLMFQKDMK